jgi:hypothetical protein
MFARHTPLFRHLRAAHPGQDRALILTDEANILHFCGVAPVRTTRYAAVE